MGQVHQPALLAALAAHRPLAILITQQWAALVAMAGATMATLRVALAMVIRLIVHLLTAQRA